MWKKGLVSVAMVTFVRSSVWLDAAAPAEGAKEKEKGWGSAVTD